jgi:hypothetical protein
MTRIASILIFILICFIAFSACQTSGCPNCVNPKPAYYNKAKAREARRMIKQNNSTSATGGTVYIDDQGEKKKGRTVRSKTRKTEKLPLNEPIL